MSPSLRLGLRETRLLWCHPNSTRMGQVALRRTKGHTLVLSAMHRANFAAASLILDFAFSTGDPLLTKAQILS